MLTTACLLAYEDYSAEGVAETDVSAVAIPRAVFEDMIARSSVFRRFVFTAYSRRITDLFMVIEEVAFRRVDIRLAQKLLELASGAAALDVTHQRLAAELGTAREVVSDSCRSSSTAAGSPPRAAGSRSATGRRSRRSPPPETAPATAGSARPRGP